MPPFYGRPHTLDILPSQGAHSNYTVPTRVWGDPTHHMAQLFQTSGALEYVKVPRQRA